MSSAATITMACDSDATTATLNQPSQSPIILHGCMRDKVGSLVFLIGAVASGGLLLLATLLSKSLKYRLLYRTVSLASADHVIIKSSQDVMISKVEVINAPLHAQNFAPERFFLYQNLRYRWNYDRHCFEQLDSPFVSEATCCADFHKISGSTIEQAQLQRLLFGSNNLDVKITPIHILAFRTIYQPFYIFQIISCVIMSFLDYWIFAICIAIMSILCITLVITFTRKMQRRLHEATRYITSVRVIRPGNEPEECLSDLLVPGDIIELPLRNWIIPCDAVLTSGACVVSEAMLTGESEPITKTPVPDLADERFSPTIHSGHILYNGTTLIQSSKADDEPVKAVVLRTGFLTRKGDLIRSLLFPKVHDFKFHRDSNYYIISLALIGVVFGIYLFVVFLRAGMDPLFVSLWAFAVITIVVPPALPAALTIAVYFSQLRLKAKKIYSVSPKCILVSGAIDTVCFDKTGTLTEDNLDISGVLECEDGRLSALKSVQDLHENSELLRTMVVCHSLISVDGALAGDPLDQKMFEATHWRLSEAVNSSKLERPGGSVGGSIVVLRQYTFSSRLKRMSVVVHDEDSTELHIYTKGAPEVVERLCLPATVPRDLRAQLQTYTRQGCRVIAMGCRPLRHVAPHQVKHLAREEAEQHLHFSGLLVLHNGLKQHSQSTVDRLRDANIRTVMLTGDNLQTAVSVACQSRLLLAQRPVVLVHARVSNDNNASVTFFTVDSLGQQKPLEPKYVTNNSQLVLSGESWNVIRHHFAHLAPLIRQCGAVLARMSPEEKAQFIECLQSDGHYVAMCGDGANDCSALKTAHAGISLSDTEASVASPFTSKVHDIRCVPALIKEGRASLVSTFGIFKLMVLYAMSQLAATMLVTWHSMFLSPSQYLWQDLFQVTTLVITFCCVKPAKRLVARVPATSLIGFKPMCETIFHIALIFAVQIGGYLWICAQPWCDFGNPKVDSVRSHPNRVVWELNILQIISSALVVAHSAPFRRSIFTNKPYSINVLLILASTLYICLQSEAFTSGIFQLAPIESVLIRIDIVLLALANFQISYIFERFVCENYHLHRQLKLFFIKTGACRLAEKLWPRPTPSSSEAAYANLAFVSSQEAVFSTDL